MLNASGVRQTLRLHVGARMMYLDITSEQHTSTQRQCRFYQENPNTDSYV